MSTVRVPAAISSELDHGGEERIHIAWKVPDGPIYVTNPLQLTGNVPDGEVGDTYSYQYVATGGVVS